MTEKDVTSKKEVVSKSAVRLTFFVVVTLFFIALMYVSYRSDQRDEGLDQNTVSIKENQDRINQNTDTLQKIVREQCIHSQLSATSLNEVLDALIQGAIDSTVFTPAEKTSRVERWRDSKVKIPVC